MSRQAKTPDPSDLDKDSNRDRNGREAIDSPDSVEGALEQMLSTLHWQQKLVTFALDCERSRCGKTKSNKPVGGRRRGKG